jgi:NitT/TauT family transport system substrate-binding protein
VRCERWRGGPVKLRLASFPSISYAPLQLGIQKGFFKKEGITLEMSVGGHGATDIPPALVSGHLDAGIWSYGTLGTLASAGLPVVAVAAMDVGPARPEDDYFKVVATERSGIDSIEELKGKTVAINSVGGFAELQARAAVVKGGLEADDIKVVAIPYPDMPAALREGRVDAASINEPYLTQVLDDPDAPVKVLSPALWPVMPKVPFGNVIMARKYVDENPEVVERFQRALLKSARFATEHPDEIRALLPDYANISPELAKKVKLPTWPGTVDPDAVQRLADQLTEYGLLDKEVDMSDYLLASPGNARGS